MDEASYFLVGRSWWLDLRCFHSVLCLLPVLHAYANGILGGFFAFLIVFHCSFINLLPFFCIVKFCFLFFW